VATRDAVELRDARALRAYAHPVRMRIIGLLRQLGPMTATQLAERLSESSGSTSYHLRQLARFGLVEEAGGGIGREKPWQATALFTHLPDTETSTAMAQASVDLRLALARRWHELLLDWIVRRPGEPRRWRRAAPFNDYGLYVTAEELAELDRQIDDLLRPYITSRDKDHRPRGSRHVTFVTYGVPR
jgi:DNA-binding transcriptional ArsR family regulator